MGTEEHNIVGAGGKAVGTVALHSDVFSAPVRAGAVHAVVRWQRAKRRAGTHSCLNRAAIGGSGRKPFKQKGTGNARAGSRRSPIWVGGAVTHGPSPRDYTFSLNKKVKRQALASVLSDRRAKERLLVVEKFPTESAKTKDMHAFLKDLGLCGKRVALVVSSNEPAAGNDIESVRRVSSNIPKLQSLPVSGVNVYDLTIAHTVVIAKEALEELTARVRGEKKEGDE